MGNFIDINEFTFEFTFDPIHSSYIDHSSYYYREDLLNYNY